MRRPAPALIVALIALAAPIGALADSGGAGTTGGTGPTGPTGPTAPTGPVIAQGISVGGVNVSGLTEAKAVDKLSTILRARLGRTRTVRAAHRQFRISPGRLGLHLNAKQSAHHAFVVGQRVDRPRRVDLAPWIKYDRRKIVAYVNDVARAAYRPARNARLHLAAVPRLRNSRKGRRLLHGYLIGALIRALKDPKRLVIGAKVRQTQAHVTSDRMRRRWSTLITIQQGTFKLRLYKRLKKVRTYGVAVGQPAYPTPYGLFHIQDKQVNPAWTAPNSPWAGELAGTTTAGGSPSNPLKARWMGVVNGVGIHGTGEDWSIGSRASHGCIRMHVSDVIALFDRTPVGTPVLIT